MARYVLDSEGRRLRDHYKMVKWIREDERRPRYFESVDFILSQLRQDEVDPPDKAVTSMLAIMIGQDDGFTDLILRKADSNTNWQAVRLVCAEMIYEMYIRETEKGLWPETI